MWTVLACSYAAYLLATLGKAAIYLYPWLF